MDKKYTVYVSELRYATAEVYAASEEEAEEIVLKKWENDQLLFHSGEIIEIEAEPAFKEIWEE